MLSRQTSSPVAFYVSLVLNQGCGSETINFRSGSYLEGNFRSGSCPRVFSVPDPDPAHGSFRIREEGGKRAVGGLEEGRGRMEDGGGWETNRRRSSFFFESGSGSETYSRPDPDPEPDPKLLFWIRITAFYGHFCAEIELFMLKIVFLFYHCICFSRGLIPNVNFGSGSGSYSLAYFGSGSWKVKVSDPYGSGFATLY